MLWSLLKPLALGAVLFVALSQIVRIRVDNYHLVLLTGLFPWVWFQTAVLMATPSFTNNAPLLKKVPFPRFVLPLSTILNAGVHFLITIPVLVILLGIAGRFPAATWLIGIPVLVVLQLGLLMGLVLLMASIDVFFRDLEHFVEVSMTLLFYLTPILYPLELVPERWRPVVLANPLTALIGAWRDLFMDNRLPGLDLWPTVLFMLIVAVLGGLVFRRLEPGFGDAL